MKSILEELKDFGIKVGPSQFMYMKELRFDDGFVIGNADAGHAAELIVELHNYRWTRPVLEQLTVDDNLHALHDFAREQLRQIASRPMAAIKPEAGE